METEAIRAMVKHHLRKTGQDLNIESIKLLETKWIYPYHVYEVRFENSNKVILVRIPKTSFGLGARGVRLVEQK